MTLNRFIHLFLNALLIFVIIQFCYSHVSKADGIELQEAKITYKQFLPGGVDPLITENGLHHNLDKELSLHLDMDVYQYFYWDNVVTSRTDSDNDGNGQFRLVGWNFAIGVHVTDYIDFGYNHFSRHLLDYNSASFDHFPVEDAVELNLYLFRKKNPGKGLF